MFQLIGGRQEYPILTDQNTLYLQTRIPYTYRLEYPILTD